MARVMLKIGSWRIDPEAITSIEQGYRAHHGSESNDYRIMVKGANQPLLVNKRVGDALMGELSKRIMFKEVEIDG